MQQTESKGTTANTAEARVRPLVGSNAIAVLVIGVHEIGRVIRRDGRVSGFVGMDRVNAVGGVQRVANKVLRRWQQKMQGTGNPWAENVVLPDIVAAMDGAAS